MNERTVPDEGDAGAGMPDEPRPDSYEWTSEPEDPDAAGMPGEYVNEPGDGVPGVRSTEEKPA